MAGKTDVKAKVQQNLTRWVRSAPDRDVEQAKRALEGLKRGLDDVNGRIIYAAMLQVAVEDGELWDALIQLRQIEILTRDG